MARLINRSIHSLKIPNTQHLAGNSDQYSVANSACNVNLPLKNKTILFLGSSITFGSGSLGESFVDYLNKEDQLNVIKDAITNTDLAGKQNKYGDSYVTRLKRIPITPVDGIIIQLSTNDGRHGIKLGKISNSKNLSELDYQTTLGAIEYICAYVKKYWKNCPLAFYTCLREANDYDILVKKLKELQLKWHFSILDLRSDFNVKNKIKKDPETRVDDAHPTRKGYKLIWTPFFRRELVRWLKL